MYVLMSVCWCEDGSASEMVSPNKSRDEVEQEAREGKHLYIKSHNSYEVGELHILNLEKVP